MIPNDRFKLWARLQAGLLTAWEQELHQADSSSWGCGQEPCLAHAAGDALPVGSSEADSDTPALFPRVTSPQSISSGMGIFPKIFGGVQVRQVVYTSSQELVWAHQDLCLLLLGWKAASRCGRDLLWDLPCMAVWKTFRLMVESQKGCHRDKDLQKASAHSSVGWVWGVTASFQPWGRRGPLVIPPLAARPAGSMKGHQKPVPEPATKQARNWSTPCREGLEYLISILCLDV